MFEHPWPRQASPWYRHDQPNRDAMVLAKRARWLGQARTWITVTGADRDSSDAWDPVESRRVGPGRVSSGQNHADIRFTLTRNVGGVGVKASATQVICCADLSETRVPAESGLTAWITA